MSKLIFDGGDWDFDIISRLEEECANIAFNELNFNCYPNQIEVISSDQMIDAYTTHGMPVYYKHWSFGKAYTYHKKSYDIGASGLAYEIVINSSPCISYLMEQNSPTMQALVIAHAAFGHNHFFKNNCMFKQFTDASGVIDFLVYAKDLVRKCEEKYGETAVEELLDSCHALQYHGIDRYTRPHSKSKRELEEQAHVRAEYLQSQVSELWASHNPFESTESKNRRKMQILPEPEENILMFIEQKSPILDPWQRQIIRIVREMSQYFWPQMQTKVANEGFASWSHHTIMNRLWEKELISSGSMLEFMSSHSNVLTQLPGDHPRYNGMNPYYLGFNILKDIERICTDPTEEDKVWFPHLIGENSNEVILDAVSNYKDESFIMQYMSPHLIRKMRLYVLRDNVREDRFNYTVRDIHDDIGYSEVRQALARQHNMDNTIPQIAVQDVDIDGDRTLYLRHRVNNGIQLETKTTIETMRHVKRLWGFNVKLESWDPVNNQSVETFNLAHLE